MYRKIIPFGNVAILGVLLVITLLLVVKLFDGEDWRKNQKNSQSNNDVSMAYNLLVTQRNNLAKLLNQKQQIIGRMKCEELNRTNIERKGTTDAGGWCLTASKTKHYFDKPLAAALATFLKGKTIASFGDGPGRYKKAVIETGLVKTYDAYDGAPYCEETSIGQVKFLDLTLPQFGLPVYDWILCLEVAEHVPKAFEEILLSNIVRHAREGVILSWAIPGQGGYSHINNQPPAYVISSMASLGFVLHTDLTDQIRGSTKNTNLNRNIKVFYRKDQKAVDELSYNA